VKLFQKFFAELAALIIILIYISTLAVTVIHLDVGELATVQATLGIAHPTGYPLYTIIGFIFSKILFFVNTIYALNLLAAVYCAISVYLLVKLSYFVLDNLEITDENSKKKKKKNFSIELDESQKITISITIGWMIGLSKTFWFQSTSVEVYSLHLLLLSFILLFTVKAYFTGDSKYWYLTAVFLALGFSNHMTTILIIPGIAFLFFYKNRFNKPAFIIILKMLLIFTPILVLLYLYLPIRAAQDPVLNWGNPVDWERFFRHVSGKQYQVWIFSSIEAVKKQFEYFISTLPSELAYVGLVTSIIGIPYLYRLSKILFSFFLINFVATLLYSINYDIADIDAYFLLAYISLIFLSIGILIHIIKKISTKYVYTLLLIPIIMLSFNYTKVDQSRIYVFEDYTKTVLDLSDNESIIFSYMWDYLIAPSYYFQYVEGYRDDVNIIDKELLRRSWYFIQLEKNMPEVTVNIKPEIESFLKALQPFERDEPFDPNFLERNYRALMTALVEKNINERDFYITPELFQNEMQRGEFQLPQGFSLVPMELFFKVVKSPSEYVDADPTMINIRFSKNPGHYESTIRRFIANMMVYRIAYELQFKEIEKAKNIYLMLINNYPEQRIPQSIIEQMNQLL